MRYWIVFLPFLLGCQTPPLAEPDLFSSVTADIGFMMVPVPDYAPIYQGADILLRYRKVSGDSYAVVPGHPVNTINAFLTEERRKRTVAIAPKVDVLVPAAKLPTPPWEIIVRNEHVASGVASYQRIGD